MGRRHVHCPFEQKKWMRKFLVETGTPHIACKNPFVHERENRTLQNSADNFDLPKSTSIKQKLWVTYNHEVEEDSRITKSINAVIDR